ncbi:MAG TPA: hypothetical protein VGC42_27345 [Kofleriaceae bacterium]
MIDRERAEQLLRARAARRHRSALTNDFTAEWFPDQRRFYEDPGRLVAAICGRRAGKTRGGNRHFVKAASQTTHGRFLYLNSTRLEARKLAWIGARGDGMKSLCERYKLEAVANESDLSIHFPAIDSWIYLMGADDEAGISKALGMPYHEVWWDEAQKIPSKLAPTIRDVLMPTLLDYRGRLRLTGTPIRNMAGLFYDVTQPNMALRRRGWGVHHWNLLSNPFFGRAEERGGQWFVIAGMGEVVSGPHELGELEAAVVGARHTRGMLDLQELLGGPEVAPLDSPTMRREGKGEWVHEDSNHVYWAHKVRRDQLCYAPARMRDDGFPDVVAAMNDLPGYPDREYFLAFGNDLGTRDPYAFCLWAWSMSDQVLYEVASYSRSGLDYDEMGARMRAVSEVVRIGITVADAGGGGKPAVMGWSKTWQDRYRLPIIEATKDNKYQAITMLNTDMVNGRIRVREGGALLEEWLVHQWSSIVSSTGRQIEDPTTPNHVSDAALYAHRESYHHRFREPPPKVLPGSPESLLQEEREYEDVALVPIEGPYGKR